MNKKDRIALIGLVVSIVFVGVLMFLYISNYTTKANIQLMFLAYVVSYTLIMIALIKKA